MGQVDPLEDAQAFWNRRAELGAVAGTKDLIAKQLEIDAIAKYVCDGMRILEIGCGNGITALELARRHCIELVGIDYAENMVRQAQTAKVQALKGRVRFEVGDFQTLANSSDTFNLIYTERVLINLPDWSAQQNAVTAIARLLAPDGLYVMCENSQEGLDKINALRQLLDLPPIIPPWHNIYIRDEAIKETTFPGLTLERIDIYSSTYYFLSRVVNAWLAAQEGKDPEYDATVNQLALRLPPIGDCGQGRIWVWRKIR